MNIDMAALHAIEADKGISVDVVVDTIKSALLTAYRHTEGHEALGEPQGTPGPRGGDRGEPFGKDAAVTVAIAAKPLADAQLQPHTVLRPGQVRQGAPVVTMDASGWGGAQRTGGVGLRRLHAQGDLRRGVVDVTRLKAQARGIR